MNKIPFQQIRDAVAKSELDYLESVAVNNVESEAELADYQEEELQPLKEQFSKAKDIEELAEILQNELGIDNPMEYILINYVIAK